MASVFDAATCILSRAGGMTAMKLQKLVYYAQAWSLVWDERPLFRSGSRRGRTAPYARYYIERIRDAL